MTAGDDVGAGQFLLNGREDVVSTLGPQSVKCLEFVFHRMAQKCTPTLSQDKCCTDRRITNTSNNVVVKQQQLEMWANAKRDGRPAEYRWRALFNAAKFG